MGQTPWGCAMLISNFAQLTVRVPAQQANWTATVFDIHAGYMLDPSGLVPVVNQMDGSRRLPRNTAFLFLESLGKAAVCGKGRHTEWTTWC